jgi:hypothetical protein
MRWVVRVVRVLRLEVLVGRRLREAILLRIGLLSLVEMVLVRGVGVWIHSKLVEFFTLFVFETWSNKKASLRIVYSIKKMLFNNNEHERVDD